ncbi:MAG: alanine dehydrogenase [Acidiferrobacter sp.]
MRIGIPKEIKPWEARVALVPHAVAALVQAGHEVFLEAGAGQGSGFADSDYTRHGARIAEGAAALYRAASLIVKVKEPVAAEYSLLRADHTLFSYLHLAANRPLTEALCAAGVTAVAFETVVQGGALPLLAPMSEIAGRLAVQIGCQLLHAPAGGRGVLLGGLPGTERGHVVVIGAGEAGGNAVRLAAAIGAQVTVFDKLHARLSAMAAVAANVTALPSYEETIAQAVSTADLVIGAVLVAGARAPRVVTRSMVGGMRHGAVMIDIAIDQGGCIETMRPTDYGSPTYIEEGVVHFGVTNMPGAVPRTASQALSAVLLPYVQVLAKSGVDDKSLTGGLNVRAGQIVHAAVAAALASC